MSSYPGKDQRVAIEEGRFVILRKTINDIFHGYTVDWNELNSNWTKYSPVINPLRDNNLITISGKIIK